MNTELTVPIAYCNSLNEIIKILDAYVPNFNPTSAWKIVRMAAILDAENYNGFTLQLLINKYIELHNIGREL